MKKILLILFAASFFGSVAISQDAKYSQQLINRFEKIKSYNSSVLKNGKYRPRCITPILRDVKKNWDKLTDEAKDYFKVFVTRPTLSGTELIEITDYFDIHYTVSGSDSVSITDNNPANSVPDYIDFMAALFDSVYLADSLRNFTMPPFDDGKGGSEYLDVYVGAFMASNTYGYVSFDSLIGDNPKSSAIVEINAATGFVVMRNDYSGFSGTEKNNIRVTFAHEFSHAIDYGYNSNLSGVFMEAKGPWEEDIVFPGLDDNLQYLSSIFCTPDIALNWDDAEGNPDYEGHWYGGWIFYKYITERTNDDIIRKFLTGMINIPNESMVDELDVIDSVLKVEWNAAGFDSMFVNFLIANALLESTSIFAPYIYNKALIYDDMLTTDSDCSPNWIYVEDTINFTGTLVYHFSNINGNGRLMRLGADYFDITANQNFSVVLIADNPTADLDLILIKYNTVTNAFAVELANAEGTDVIIVTDQSLYDFFRVIVFYPDYYITDTLSEQYTLTIDAVTGINNNLSVNTYFNVYPNPAINYITLDYELNSTNVNIQIIDVLGRVKYDSQNSHPVDQFSINTENWSEGMYYLIVKDNTGYLFSQNFIISK